MSCLLPYEKEAKAFVLNTGLDRANKLLTAICNRIDRRITIANNQMCSGFIDNTCVRKSHWEIEMISLLKMGLQLLNTDTPDAAKQRILERIKARKAKRSLCL